MISDLLQQSYYWMKTALTLDICVCFHTESLIVLLYEVGRLHGITVKISVSITPHSLFTYT